MANTVIKQTNRAFRSLAGIDLAAMDVEIERQKAELDKLMHTRVLIAQIQESVASNGSNVADPTRPAKQTIADRIRSFLAGGKEATAAEIAEGIGVDRAPVYSAMRSHEEAFRQKENRWRLK